MSETLTITQSRNESFKELPKDIQVSVASATANTTNSGYGIEKTYDNNESTFGIASGSLQILKFLKPILQSLLITSKTLTTLTTLSM